MHMPSLPHFREFTIWLKAETRTEVASSTLNKLYRARARHKFAKQFLGLKVDKGTAELVRGYSAGVRLFLCYSAAEAMGDAVGKHVAGWLIREESLETPLRRIAKPLPQRSDVLSKGVRQGVEAFLARDHNNVRVVATALRHLVAHGEFTPTGVGLMTKSGADAVTRLGDCLLAESERQFAAWFKNAVKDRATTDTAPSTPRR